MKKGIYDGKTLFFSNMAAILVLFLRRWQHCSGNVAYKLKDPLLKLEILTGIIRSCLCYNLND